MWYTWCIVVIGETESYQDKMRSILAQFEFTKKIREFESKGVSFGTYMYVPEKYPDTGDFFMSKRMMSERMMHTF